ncbi:MAG: hypothetical protein ACE5F3_00415 [Mariprofundaceae bacterium]
MILKYKRELLSSVLLALAIAIAGCDGANGSSALPEVGPEAVTKQFYEYISESKLRGATPAKAAYKLIDGEASNINIHQFLEIIKRYPPGFVVDVGKAKISGTQAVVAISYKMRSSFGGAYTVEGELPLNVDQDTHTWKIDFTGDTYGMQKDEFMALEPENSQ